MDGEGAAVRRRVGGADADLELYAAVGRDGEGRREFELVEHGGCELVTRTDRHVHERSGREDRRTGDRVVGEPGVGVE
nr:hypothetical protein [Streptomyces sp. wa1063]